MVWVRLLQRTWAKRRSAVIAEVLSALAGRKSKRVPRVQEGEVRGGDGLAGRTGEEQSRCHRAGKCRSTCHEEHGSAQCVPQKCLAAKIARQNCTFLAINLPLGPAAKVATGHVVQVPRLVEGRGGGPPNRDVCHHRYGWGAADHPLPNQLTLVMTLVRGFSRVHRRGLCAEREHRGTAQMGGGARGVLTLPR
jgi:hypothetical protein